MTHLLLACCLQTGAQVEFKQFQFEPQIGIKFSPLEVRFDIGREYENPFDPKIIDVSLLVSGPKELQSVQCAFWASDCAFGSDGNVIETGSPGWRIRFAPWERGVYSMFPTAIDSEKRYDGKRIDVRANDSNLTAFVSVREKESYFRTDKEVVYPIIREIGAKPAAKLITQLNAAADSGANCVFLRVPTWLPIQKGLALFDMKNAWALDQVFLEAQKRKMMVLLALDEGKEMRENWSKNPYRAICSSPDDFFRSLKARAAYKKYLRYLISRIGAYDNLLGIELFYDYPAPDYWVQEMTNEIQALHTYGAMISSSPGTKDVWTQKQVGFATAQIAPVESAVQSAASVAREIASIRKDTDKPIVCLLSNPSPYRSGSIAAAWASLICGGAGAAAPFETSGAFDLAGMLAFSKKISWQKEQRTVQDVAGMASGFAKSFLGDSGGCFLLITDQTQGAKTVELKVRRDKKYRYEIIDIETGRVAAQGEASSEKKTLSIPVPEFRLGLAGIIN